MSEVTPVERPARARPFNLTNIAVVIILLLAALLRLAFIFEIAQYPFMLVPQGGSPRSAALDYSAFDNSALYLAGHIRDKLGLPPIEQRHPRAHYFFTAAPTHATIEDYPARESINHPDEPPIRPPLYVYFLGALYFVFGDNQIAIRLAQGMVGLCSAWLAYMLARRLGARIAAFFPLTIGAFYWPLIIYENVHHDKTVVTCCLLLLGYFAFRWADRRTARNAMLLGAVFGVTLYGTPALTAFVPVLMLWMVWVVYQRDCDDAVSVRRMLQPAVTMFLTALAVTTPFLLRNFYVTGKIFWLVGTGITMMVAVCFITDQAMLEPPGATGPYWDDNPADMSAAARLDLSLDLTQSDHALDRMAIGYILSNPFTFAGRTLLLAPLFWSPKENHGLSIDYLFEYPMRLLSPTLDRVPGNFSLALIPFVLGLGLFCHAWLRRLITGAMTPASGDRTTDLTILVSVSFLMLLIAVWYAPYIILPPRALYRIPLVPLMSVVGAWGFARMFACARARNWRGPAFGAVPAAVLLPVIFLVPISYEADVSRWLTANVAQLQQRGRLDDAMAVAQRIADSRPHYADVQNETAVLLVNYGKESEALRYYLRALNAMPASRTDLADHVANQITRLLLQFEEQMDMAPLYQNILDDYGHEYSTMIALARSFLLREAPDKAMLFLEAAQGAGPVDAAHDQLMQEAQDALGRT